MAINFLNTAIGTSATFTGVVTLTDRLVLSDSLKNSFIGENTGVNNTTGDENIGLGYNSLFSNTTGGHNTAIGKYSLYSNISGSYNIAIGQQALYSSTSSSNNIGIGFLSLYTNLSGFANIGLGERSLEKNTTGAANIAIGPQALWNNTTGGNNSATGYWSLYANTTGNGNAAFGSNSLVSNTTGSDNVAMGIYSGKWIADGSTPNATSENSIFIGSNTRANANSETNQIVIGGDAIGNGSNTVTLGNDSIVKTILKGTITAPSYGAGTLVTDAAGNITTSSGGGAGGPFLPLAAGSGFPLTGALTGTSATFAGAITGSNLSGTNTGDQDLSGYVTLATAQTITGAKTIDTLKIGSANKIQFANNDFIRYEDATGVGRFHFDSDGGTNNSSVQAATFVGALSGNASSATTLQTARTIAGVSFDGSANISLNNNAITNGAGYITSASLPSVGNGTLTMTTSTGLDGGATFTANQSGNSAFAVTLDLTEITLSAGLDSTATGLSLDLSEFTDMTAAMLTTDEFIVLDSGAERRKAAGEIGLSIFNNDSNFITAASLPTVSNATITLAAGDVLDGGGAFTLNQSANETITFDLATGGAGAAVYGSTSDSTKIDQITLDAYGRVTAVSTGATGQVNSIGSGSSTTISIGGTAIVPTVSAVTAAVSSGSAALATGAQIQTAINTALVGVLSYQSTWNASTNSPTLSSGSGTAGYYYIVSVAGSTNLDGITDWAVGDWAVFSDQATDAWQKIDNTAVGSMSSFIIKEGNGTETSTVTNGETITFAQGTGIQSELTSTSSGGTLQITNTAPNIVQTTITGNAGSATVLQTARTIAGVSFNGSANISLNNNAITNGAGYITSASLPSVGNGQIDGRTTGSGLSGSMDATANQSGNTTFTVNSNATTAATASTIAYRDSAGDLNVRLLRANYANQSTISGAMAFRVNNSSDNYTRYCSSPSAIRTFLEVPASGDLNSYLLNTTDTLTGDLTVTGKVQVGDGTDGYFYSDAAGRTAFAGGQFYIQNSVGNYYNYATNQYHGNSSGDNHYFRGNPLSGNNWSIATTGIITAPTFVGALSGNATTASTATTSNLIKVNNYTGTTNMRILGSHQTGGSDNVYSSTSMYLNCDTGIINATGFNATPILYSSNQSAYALKMGASNSTAFDQGIKLKSDSGGSSYISINARSEDTLVLKAGKVGIGTPSPQHLLHISDDTGLGFAMERTGSAPSTYTISNSSARITHNYVGGANGYRWQVEGTMRLELLENGNLYLNGSTALKVGGGSWGNYSDERVKKDISNYTKGLDEILSINPVTYKYNGKANIVSEKQFVGIIAQEIKEVLPSTVEVTPTKLNDEDEFDTDLLTFDASELTFTLINAVKELKAEIEELKKQINK